MYTEHFNGTTTRIQLRYLKVFQLRYLKVWVDILHIRYRNTDYVHYPNKSGPSNYTIYIYI